MHSIVSHLWQTQIENCTICPTLIKAQNTLKYYFYSSKKKRVLRKKQIDFPQIQSTHKKEQSKILFSFPQQQTISFSFVSFSEFKDKFFSESKCVSYFIENDSQIVKVAVEENQVRVKDWQNKEINGQKIMRMAGYVKKIKQYIEVHLSKKFSKNIEINEFNLIIMVKEGQISIIEATKFILNMNSFFNFSYKIVNKKIENPPMKQQVNSSEHENMQKCIICQSLFAEGKQISVEEVKKQLKKRGKSARCCEQDYYEVCFKCYSNI